jgi:predicted nuclease of predicted toxin-antitoxin system
MRFLVDAQLPPALADWLRQHGQEAEHVFDRGLTNADDPVIWAYAVQFQLILITKDEDFLAIRVTSGGPAVVWLRIGNATNRALLKWFAPRFPAILAALAANEPVVEVR